MKYLYGYLAVISLIAVIFTIYDKHAARKGKWRIKERTLLIIAGLGGSVVMLATMLAARHKIRKAKFMVGIPVITLLQIVAFVVIYKWILLI